MSEHGFAGRLKELREQSGLSQAELAEAAGMNAFGVAKLEQGVREPLWATVQALARALGVEVGEFVVADDPPPAKDKRPVKPAGAPSGQKKASGGKGRKHRNTAGKKGA